ncbi:hypothetical protein Tco_0714550 [Tanacetum coccineum]
MSNRHQELASPEQTASGKAFSNPFMADSLPKTIWFSTHHASHLPKNYMVINAPCYCNEALDIPEQMTTGKETSNPFMAGSFPKTTRPTYSSLSKSRLKNSYVFGYILQVIKKLKLKKHEVSTASTSVSFGSRVSTVSSKLVLLAYISQTIRLWTNIIQEEFSKEVQGMLNFFESMETEVDKTSKKHEILQNDFDRLLEATLAIEVRNCIVHYVEQIENEKLRDEIEKILSDSKLRT